MEVCVKCRKAAYPVEKLSFLDQVWHKKCFTCASCGCTLNLQNAKGFEKKPYCVTHYPKLVATPIGVDPETQRNTDAQSNVSSVHYKAQGRTTRFASEYVPKSSPKTAGDSGDVASSATEAGIGSTTSSEYKSMFRAKSFHTDESPSATTADSEFQRRLPQRRSSLTMDVETYSDPKYFCITEFKKTRDDEVDTAVDDLLFVEKVFDDGWAYALNSRTGLKGILPFNFLEKR
ncbi:LIM and SH3 domain protein 1 [Thelohanellus kitauei]|uniref:LIM and SH3 domain protein 1 n=1 Tax=Thelohanellus kitauei TaxID=669202 RepID=A0A0C2MIP6_THEKT|nr:LIM and SH3 domain protein 1 [Thelohanellus kitauei]